MFCKVTMLPYTALYILHHPDNYLLTLDSDIKQNHENETFEKLWFFGWIL